MLIHNDGNMEDTMRPGIVCGLLALGLVGASSRSSYAAAPHFRCRDDGTFKIVILGDPQDDAQMDPRTTMLMEQILDAEKPDLVVIAGDCIAGGECKTEEQVLQAISHVAYPMEQRKIAWAIVFGNHDQEHYPATKLGKEEVFGIYQSYPHNVNTRGSKEIHGVGNSNLLIWDYAGEHPIFCLWLIDSGDYAPKRIGGYDWVHTDQVCWYYHTSSKMERRYGRKIPGLMCLHTPLCEFTEMALNSDISGDRCEPECSAKINSGLFAAVLDRGDVKGIFCGHHHINNYMGEWMGIKLGYVSSVGYAPYNLPDDDPRSTHSRGGRVFLINQSDPESFTTWLRFPDGSTDQ